MPAQSLFFFTFHKCASVFFGRFALGRSRGLEQVDYAHRMFFDPATVIEFAARGHLYGPLRLSAQGAVLERLIVPALQVAQGDDVRTCLMVRDPRDMLVSQFFHNRDGAAIQAGLAAAETKERERSDAVHLGIDRYVLEKATRFEAGFDRAVRLLADRPATTVLRYEDMVDDWPGFLGSCGRCSTSTRTPSGTSSGRAGPARLSGRAITSVRVPPETIGGNSRLKP